jgi:putative DNA primase/helicase
MSKDQTYAHQVADAMIAQLERGTAPWMKPWSPGERFLPFNPVSGAEYRGGNSVWLLASAQTKGYDDPRWMTYKQAQEAGAQVRKGEKSTTVQYWKWPDKDKQDKDDQIKDEDAQSRSRGRPSVFSASVFNAAQIDGLPPLERRQTAPEWERHAKAEAILAASGVPIRHVSGDRAFYSPGRDAITLPERGQFAKADLYYETALHELGHASGHPSRLNRDLSHPFGSEGYAREELRAEIASLMLGDRLEIGHNPERHAGYVQSWIKALHDDPREIFRAASDAEKIVGYVQGLARAAEREQGLGAPAQTRLADKEEEARRAPAAPGAGESVGYVQGLYLSAEEKPGQEEKKAEEAQLMPAAGARAPAVSLVRVEREDLNPREAFAEALRGAGFDLQGEPEMDGRRHRCKVAGDKAGQQSGSYRGFLDGVPAGSFTNFKTGEQRAWSSKEAVDALTPGDRARLRAESAERARDRDRREEEAHKAAVVHIAGRLWEPAQADHPYLARKGVEAHGVFVERGALLVPMHSLDGALTGAQRIAPDGEKRTLKGSRPSGACHMIGEPAASPMILVAEGYATAATLHRLTGFATAVAFNAGNLAAVTRGLKERYPHSRIIIAGDNDHEKDGKLDEFSRPMKNVGKEKADQAASALGVKALLPQFGGSRGSDWNDLAASKGDDEARSQLQAGLAVAERHELARGVKARRVAGTEGRERTQERERPQERGRKR